MLFHWCRRIDRLLLLSKQKVHVKTCWEKFSSEIQQDIQDVISLDRQTVLPPCRIHILREINGGLMSTRLFIVGLAILLPAVSSATVVKQRPYDYSFEAANVTKSDVFVVCTN